MIGTFWSVVPPLLAVTLALITKEVYFSLLFGIFVGALFYTNFSLLTSLEILLNKGLIAGITDKQVAGILVFLILLGIIVAILNETGASSAFGTFVAKRCKSKQGAIFSSFALGVLFFIDDYFNCLTVGAVMRPVIDEQKVARAKLAYIIDATAAPICMIAPISSWAAAVSTTAKSLNNGVSGIQLFCQAIPYNFYSIFTIFFIIFLTKLNFDYGPMRIAQERASAGNDIDALQGLTQAVSNPRARVLDLLVPIAVLVTSCVWGMLYVGGFWRGVSFIDAFAGTDSSIALPMGATITFIFTVLYAIIRRTLAFSECSKCITKGFIAMVPAILVLVLAIALKNISNLLLISQYVSTRMSEVSGTVYKLLPAVIFLIGCILAFATGTSWATFGILIPIIVAMFPPESKLFIIGISACLAGAVCGDHCSPISDTTIMASAGSQCNHMPHVKTQLPYAITVATICFITYIIAGYTCNLVISWSLGITMTFLTLLAIKHYYKIKKWA